MIQKTAHEIDQLLDGIDEHVSAAISHASGLSKDDLQNLLAGTTRSVRNNPNWKIRSGGALAGDMEMSEEPHRQEGGARVMPAAMLTDAIPDFLQARKLEDASDVDMDFLYQVIAASALRIGLHEGVMHTLSTYYAQTEAPAALEGLKECDQILKAKIHELGLPDAEDNYELCKKNACDYGKALTEHELKRNGRIPKGSARLGIY